MNTKTHFPPAVQTAILSAARGAPGNSYVEFGHCAGGDPYAAIAMRRPYTGNPLDDDGATFELFSASFADGSDPNEASITVYDHAADACMGPFNDPQDLEAAVTAGLTALARSAITATSA